MKQFLLFFGCVAMLCSCNSNQKKAERLVKQYMKENLDDPKSYSPGSFSKLKPITVRENLKESIEDISIYRNEISDFISEWQKSLNFARKHYSEKSIKDYELLLMNDSTRYKNLSRDIDSLQKLYDAVNEMDINSWRLEHSYRAANKMGGIEKKTETFEFDKDITEIL